MHTTYTTPTLRLSTTSPLTCDTDLVAVPVFEQDELADLPGLDAASGGHLGRARTRGALTGKAFEVVEATLNGSSAIVAVIGCGARADVSTDTFRRSATIAGLLARRERMTRVAVVLRGTGQVPDEAAVQAIAEGLTLSNYDGASYKTGTEPQTWLAEGQVLVGTSVSPSLEQALERGRVMGECTNITRSLANEPGNSMTPAVFADRAAVIAREAGLTVEVLDERRIAELKMGLLLGVARGSLEPPRVVVLRYDPPGPAGSTVLGLVGKGVTFDTGGISIKPADNMDKMKSDMSGGAAVLGAMAAIARLKAPVRCIGIIPATENMPGGKAIKPGDILTSAEGKTVEVLNTDAEGRLILGDGLWYARQLGATHLVDVATLTGSIVVALGKGASGLFGTPNDWVEQVRLASLQAGDRTWPMPVFDDYREQLKSEIADFTNTGGRAGGAITGALFIKEFSGGLPWVHMDIAGTAWAEEAKAYQPKGATGAAVRTLTHLALAANSWSGPR